MGMKAGCTVFDGIWMTNVSGNFEEGVTEVVDVDGRGVVCSVSSTDSTESSTCETRVVVLVAIPLVEKVGVLCIWRTVGFFARGDEG